jgi:epsilon-lactone hydrolase
MSWQLVALNRFLRHVARPKLARTVTPAQGKLEFDQAARRLFKVPPFTCHLVGQHGHIRLHRITLGPVQSRRVILYLHGGAYFAGSGQTHLGMLSRLSGLSGTQIIAPDYRLLQDAPFPAAFEDALAVWQLVVDSGVDPAGIMLGGDSAGGGLALALLSHLTHAGTPPAGLFAFSPWTDLSMSGQSIVTHGPDDAMLPVGRMAEVASLYLCGADERDPRASPLFARYTRPPPVLLQVGSAEALLDDSRRMAGVLEAAGGDVTWQVWPRAPHVWHMFDGYIPEARAALRKTAGFIQTSFDKASR